MDESIQIAEWVDNVRDADPATISAAAVAATETLRRQRFFPSCSAGSAPMPWALGIWLVWVADVDLLVLVTAGSSWFRA